MAGGHHNQLAMEIERAIAQNAAKQRLLFFKLRDAAMAGDDRRFTGMQRGQQRNDKQVAVFKAQRPALAFLLTQGVDQQGHVVAQLAQRPGTIVKPGNGHVVRAGRV